MAHIVKNIIIILGLLLIAGVGYYLFVLERAAETNDNSASIQSAAAESQEFLRRLQDLQSISLDTDIFADPVFTSFTSFRNPIEVRAVGRENPFSPVE